MSAPFPLDADGDCAECGHFVWLHTPYGCHETIHGADLRALCCDCSQTQPGDAPGPGIAGGETP